MHFRIAAVLSFSLLLLSPGSGSAQIVDGVGVKVGAVSSSASTSLPLDLKRRLAPTASVSVRKSLASQFSIVIEFGYFQRGFVEEQEERDEQNNSLGLVEAETRLDYFSLPILPTYVHRTRFGRLHASAGPRIDFLLHRASGEFEFSRITLESILADSYASVAFGGTAVIGAERDLTGQGSLLLELRFDIDLSDSFETGPLEMRNNAVAAVIGFVF